MLIQKTSTNTLNKHLQDYMISLENVIKHLENIILILHMRTHALSENTGGQNISQLIL